MMMMADDDGAKTPRREFSRTDSFCDFLSLQRARIILKR